MARSHAYFFYGSDTLARDAALVAALDELEPRFRFRFGEEKALGIDDAHEIARKATLSVGGDTQAFVILQADMMTHEATQAMLKILEEPPAGSVFFLVSDSTDIPATLLSRLTTQSFLGQGVSGALARFEDTIRKTGKVSRAKADSLRRQGRVDILRTNARISAQSLVEYEEICRE
ncbi:MAG: hypothetical protein AAB417_02595 [Patescibacteria group bacterium]